MSDSFCVDRHRESFLKLIDEYVDIVFCNESEVLSLFKKDKLASCQGDLSSLCELVIVTLGSNGSLIINKNYIEVIKSFLKSLSFTGESSSRPTTKTPSPSDSMSYPKELRATAIATFSEVIIF